MIPETGFHSFRKSPQEDWSHIPTRFSLPIIPPPANGKPVRPPWKGCGTGKGMFPKKTAAAYSPTCAVPSARPGLTSLFGMGRGGTPAPSHLNDGHARHQRIRPEKKAAARKTNHEGKETDGNKEKLRAISSARLCRHRLYTCALSTSSSLTALDEI